MYYIILISILKEVLGQNFEILSEYMPYTSQNQSQIYNYGYWFKFQPLTQLKNEKKYGNSTNYIYLESNEYLISFELSDNTLSLWHVQTDKFVHIINLVQNDGLKSQVFQQDSLYEGRWNFFGVQVISQNQYQIIFFSNQLKILIIDGQIKRKQQQYYIGGYGTFINDGSLLHFQSFKGKLTNFIQLDEIVTESNFDDTVLSVKQAYLDSLQPTIDTYFDIINYDGQSVTKYQYDSYREGIRYAISMWVKSKIEQYSSPLNYSIFRASLNQNLTDTYLGDKQLFIQYQISLVPSENIVFAMTYSFQAPIYQFQKKNDNDWIKIQDNDLMQGLKQWHFIQFEYGRVSQPNVSPPVYNSLFTLILPDKKKQFNQDWNRDNHHFTGVPVYFFLGGALSQHENKFIGTISQFTFISYNTEDLQPSIQCHYTCLTCNGPTSSDCLTCSSEKNRVFSLNQCACKLGFVSGLSDSCEQATNKYQMVQVLETEYKCPEGYDQCEDKIVCSFGYFLRLQVCHKCPQKPSEQQQDINLYCVDCVLNPNKWSYYCEYSMLLLDSNIFTQFDGDLISFDNLLEYQFGIFDFVSYYSFSFGCQKGYGLVEQKYYSGRCRKCQNCLKCQYKDEVQTCLQCPRYYYLNEKNCIQCGTNCRLCDSNGCLECQEGSFLTLDKVNCNQCSIKNCDYCYQYYQNPITNKKSISLDLKFNQVDLSLEDIVTSCARCQDGFAIQGNTCIEYSMQSCLTGIIDNQFKCLIGIDNTGIQLNNCNLIENCYSCFISYPTNPWCIQCHYGYYVQFEDGSCITCPDICASCIRQNSGYKDSWKINIRAFYYYKFGSHLYEDYAIDTDNYQYNIICTSCKDDYILYDNTCLQGCGQNCEVCEAKDGKAVCTKCKDNQHGPIMSFDNNSQCLECPQKCYACIPRELADIQALNQQFNTQITSNEHKCYLQEKGYFLDNEFNLPVKCENSEKCFKTLIVKLDVFCTSEFTKNITNCDLNSIQQCLEDIFDQDMIYYMKKQVIKELEIILNIQDQLCQFQYQGIKQFISPYVLSLKKTTLTITSQNQSVIEFGAVIITRNFSNYIISNIILKAYSFKTWRMMGQSQKITFQQLTIIIIEDDDLVLFELQNILSLDIKDVIINVQGQYSIFFFYINNSVKYQSVQILITGLFIYSSHLTTNGHISTGFMRIISSQDTVINLNLTDITILNSQFDNQFQFIIGNGQQTQLIISNLVIENSLFQDCQFLKFENIIQQPLLQMTINNNNITNSILIQVPILTIQNSIFSDNRLYDSSILIKNIGSFGGFSGQFNFQQLLFKQNVYEQRCQFITIQQDQTNMSINIENYTSINNQKRDSLIMELNYEQGLIFIISNYVFVKNFLIKRLNGTIELSIIQSQQILIYNLTLMNNKINKIISQQLQCLSNSQNLVLYIFDTKYISIDTFIINQLSSIDYSIIFIQSQSRLKKQQNETIILKNGQIINNSLVISQLKKQISIFQIISQQQQKIDCSNLIFVKNVLNLYAQDLQMLSASTILIQSDQGEVYFQDFQFQQNYVINSTNSPLNVQSSLIQITKTIFLNNNVFDLQVLKNFFMLNYNDKISIEQISQKEYCIQSNGGSGQLTASNIIIKSIKIQESFGLNGGSLYIQALGTSNIKISDSFIMYSQTQDNINSQGGTFYIDGSKSNLQLQLENIQILSTKSRKSGGFIYLNALQLAAQITNISCINCFSINGGFMIVESTEESNPQIILTNITLQNPDFRWFIENIIDLTIEEQIIFRKNSYLLYLPNSILKVYQLQITDGNISGILYFDGKNGLIIHGILIQQYKLFLTPLITISHSQITSNLINIVDIQIKDVFQEQVKQQECKNEITQFIQPYDCSKTELIEQQQEIFSYYNDLFKENNYNCNYQNIHQTSEQSVAFIEIFNLTKNIINIENININNATYQAEYGLLSLRDFSQIRNQIKINNVQIIKSNCGNGCMLISSSTQNLLNKNKRLLVNNFNEIIDSSTSSVITKNSKFINNQAIYGSGIYMINVSAMIINTIFINNKAQNLGGAIYFSGNINNLMLLNNQIINNKASNVSGSGIYLDGITMSKLDHLQNIFIDNQQDFNEIPQGLQILFNKIILNKHMIKNDSQTYIEEVYIRPYKILGRQQPANVITLPSGQSIKDYEYFDQFSQVQKVEVVICQLQSGGCKAQKVYVQFNIFYFYLISMDQIDHVYFKSSCWTIQHNQIVLFTNQLINQSKALPYKKDNHIIVCTLQDALFYMLLVQFFKFFILK